MITRTLLISPQVIRETTVLHTNIDDKLILPEIKAVQDLYIMPLLGSPLLNKLLTDKAAGALSGNYLTLLNDYLVETMANYVLSEMATTLNYQFWNKGVAQKTSDQSQVPTDIDLQAVRAKYKNRAEHYSKRCRMYLIEKAPTMFPEYIVMPSGVDVVVPERTSFTNPIYLGEDYESKPRSYSDRYQGNRPQNIDY